MNPYDFVPVDFTIPPERRKPVQHEKFVPDTVSGRLIGKITAETPVFLKFGNTDQFTKNRTGQYIIPGTSLKGLFRSLVETVANGCFEKFDGSYTDKQRGRAKYDDKLPKPFRSCFNPDQLCIACRIFGMLNGEKRFTGKVGFQDAVCDRPVLHETVNTISLMGPKPCHSAFYLNGNQIAGRKFYFHHPSGIKTEPQKTAYNQRVTPLNTGSEFTFSADFTNMETDEWQALLYAIVLEPSTRHKIGYAKPAGFGSMRVEIEHIRLLDYSKRYTSPDRGVTEYAGEGLSRYISDQIQTYTRTTSRTLTELRRIWGWNPADTTSYRYPQTGWFKTNSNAPISGTL